MEFDILNIVLFVIGSVITLLINRELLKGVINELALELEDAIEKVQQARESDSPGGKEITPEERTMILKEGEDILVLLWNRIVRSRLLRFLGLEKKPEKGTRS